MPYVRFREPYVRQGKAEKPHTTVLVHLISFIHVDTEKFLRRRITENLFCLRSKTSSVVTSFSNLTVNKVSQNKFTTLGSKFFHNLQQILLANFMRAWSIKGRYKSIHKNNHQYVQIGQ